MGLNLPDSSVKKELLVEISKLVDGRVSTSLSHRLAYMRDLWPLKLIEFDGRHLEHFPDAVMWVKNTEEVQKVLDFCSKNEIYIIPYSGGSGVCGGVVPVKGGIILDLKMMNRVRHLNKTSLLVEVEAGINGEKLERWLQSKGYTLGHFPSSMYCSCAGGWVATRSAGQCSTLYGKIEDMVVSIEFVIPSGEVIRTKAVPRSATGPDLNQIITGSEGTLGVITSATFRIHPLPENRVFLSFFFENLTNALSSVRRILREGVKPAVVRVYDPIDTLLTTSVKKGKGGITDSLLKIALKTPSLLNKTANAMAKRCLLIMIIEGKRRKTFAEGDFAREVCISEGGEDTGGSHAEEWVAHRYSVSFGLSRIFYSGLFADTMEVASTWDKLETLYQEMRDAIAQHALVMAHFSHAYEEGCNIYFTFIAGGKDWRDKVEKYKRIWESAMSACLRVGGSISHHHGIGLLKKMWLWKEHGTGYRVLSALKGYFDPQGIMNPGKIVE